MDIKTDLKQLKEFAGLMKKSDIEELLWEKNGVKIGFKKSDFLIGGEEDIYDNKTKRITSENTDMQFGDTINRGAEETMIIKSEMVGTFYSTPAHDRHPYVKVGDYIDMGQKIGVIEAMKIMKEISSPVRGKIAKILIEDGHAVEYGQGIFVIEPIETGEKGSKQ